MSAPRGFRILTPCLAGLLLACAPLVSPPTDYVDPRPPLAPSAVQVFNAEPPFAYERIGEFTVEARPAHKEPQIRAKTQEAAAAMGGDVAVIVSRSSRRSVGVVTGAPQSPVVVAGAIEDLVVVVGRRGGHEDT